MPLTMRIGDGNFISSQSMLFHLYFKISYLRLCLICSCLFDLCSSVFIFMFFNSTKATLKKKPRRWLVIPFSRCKKSILIRQKRFSAFLLERICRSHLKKRLFPHCHPSQHYWVANIQPLSCLHKLTQKSQIIVKKTTEPNLMTVNLLYWWCVTFRNIFLQFFAIATMMQTTI